MHTTKSYDIHSPCLKISSSSGLSGTRGLTNAGLRTGIFFFYITDFTTICPIIHNNSLPFLLMYTVREEKTYFRLYHRNKYIIS